MLFALIAVVVILVLVVFWLLFQSAESSSSREGKDSFYRNAVKVIDGLQSGYGHGVESSLAEIMEADSEKKEIYVVFGNVLREKGFISEAIKVHKAVLHRPNLPDGFKGWALASLAEDFRMAGMLDRAIRTYSDAFNLNPSDRTSLQRYAHLCKQVGDYEKLLSLMDVLSNAELMDEERYRMEVAFIYNEQGEALMRDGKYPDAERKFTKAIQLNSKTYPAYLNLVQLNLDHRNNQKKALDYLQKLFHTIPEKAFLGLPVYRELEPDDFEEMCGSLLQKWPDDWRTRLHLARFLSDRGDTRAAFDSFMEAVRSASHVLLIHQEIWKFLLKVPEKEELLREYARISDQTMVFNAPFMCVECRYKSSEFLWKCPSCFGWNTFVESKI